MAMEDMTEKTSAFFSRMKQNLKITSANTKKDDQEDLNSIEEEGIEGTDEIDADGDIRLGKNVSVEKISSETEEKKVDVVSDDLSKV